MSTKHDKNQDLINHLTDIGLSENEATVYLSLLKIGEVGASKIVRDTGLHGQIVYNSLYSLDEKNLVKSILYKGRKKFSAQNPKHLVEVIEKKKTKAVDLVEKIESRFATVDDQSIEISKGVDSFVINEFKLLDKMPAIGELYIFGGPGDSFIKAMGNKINEYDYQRKSKQIKIKYLGSTNQDEYLHKSIDDRGLFDFRTLPKVFSGVTNITIFKDTAVVIYLFNEAVTTITIYNQKIIESYQDFFEGLWGLGE